MEAPFFEDVEAGYEIPPLAKIPEHTNLFMFSAVTWNRHRIHYDADFARDHNLPFPLLSDVDKKVRKLYDVKNTLGVLPARATFVIDKTGIIRFALSSQMNIQQHIDKSLEIIRNL